MHPLRRRAALRPGILVLGLSLCISLSGCGQKDPSGPGAALQGSISVSANVSAAAIRLDGEDTGHVTPFTFTGVSAGAHTVGVERAGFDVAAPNPAPVTVVANETATVTFTLTALLPLGRIAVTSDIPGAEILLDGVPTGLTEPDTLESVPVGTHSVSARNLGCTTTPDSVSVVVAEDSLSTATFDDTALEATSHTVLLEHFTNWQCVPCTQSDPELDQLYHELDRTQVVYIAYHENIASQNDPFYLHNPAENLARLAFYGVTGSPWVALDGKLLSLGLSGWESPDAYSILHDSTLAHTAMDHRLNITVEATKLGSNYRVRAAIAASSALDPGSYRLHVVVVEREPIGPEGIGHQTIYPWAMRDMIPDTSPVGRGVAFTIGPGEVVNIQQEVPFRAEWSEEEIGAVVFVQRVDNKVVVQAGSSFTQ